MPTDVAEIPGAMAQFSVYLKSSEILFPNGIHPKII